MNILYNKFKIFSFPIIVFAFLIITSFMLSGCGSSVEKQVTKLNGIIDNIEISINNQTQELNGISLIFTVDPTEFSAVYNDVSIENTKTTIENYKDTNYDGVNENAYKYSFTFNEISEENYNTSSIMINCTINKQKYQFNLTTDLLNKIYPNIEKLI